MRYFNRELEHALDKPNIYTLLSEATDRTLRIGYDMDDVLADLDNVLRQEVAKIVGKPMPHDERRSFYFENVPEILERLKLDKNQLGGLVVQSFNKVFGDRASDIRPMTDAVRVLKQLENEGHYIVIITSRKKSRSYDMTKEWLKMVGLDHIPIYFEHGKPKPTNITTTKIKCRITIKTTASTMELNLCRTSTRTCCTLRPPRRSTSTISG